MFNRAMAVSLLLSVAAMTRLISFSGWSESASVMVLSAAKALDLARCTVSIDPIAGSSQSANETRDRLRAEELIKQARAAIGGEEELRNILTLSASGKSRR